MGFNPLPKPGNSRLLPALQDLYNQYHKKDENTCAQQAYDQHLAQMLEEAQTRAINLNGEWIPISVEDFKKMGIVITPTK